VAVIRIAHCTPAQVAEHFTFEKHVWVRGHDMQGLGFDLDRYKRLLAEAVDESKRLALIELLIEERAMDRLAAQRAAEREALTAMTVARVVNAFRR
jgi:hypothetical protein